jgi:hypothetical protein
VVYREWKLRFQLKKAKSYEEFIEFATDGFNDKLLMLISEKLELLQENPFKYSREKLEKIYTEILCFP